jgi:hypothetical protein
MPENGTLEDTLRNQKSFYFVFKNKQFDMKTKQSIYFAGGISSTQPLAESVGHAPADWVIIFGARNMLEQDDLMSKVIASHPGRIFSGCSTAGEIMENNVFDESIVVTEINFEKTTLQHRQLSMDSFSDSYAAGEALIQELPKNDLRHVFVLCDGLHVNGSELVRGLRNNCPAGVNITGGLAGDGQDFQKTLVLDKAGKAAKKMITAIGFYGKDLQVGFGSYGGWDTFGMERLVTKSQSNVLYELDGTPALELYKSYLGELADQLPASGLLFPLSLRYKADHQPVVRTILSVNEQEQSLTFAGDIPQGSYVRLMKANTDRLVDGAITAAENTAKPLLGTSPELSLLISCVGRKLVLKQMIEEEIEGVREVLGDKSTFAGFYSYGEISPFTLDAKCELHNQTMTITTFSER